MPRGQELRAAAAGLVSSHGRHSRRPLRPRKLETARFCLATGDYGRDPDCDRAAFPKGAALAAGFRPLRVEHVGDRLPTTRRVGPDYPLRGARPKER